MKCFLDAKQKVIFWQLKLAEHLYLNKVSLKHCSTFLIRIKTG